MSGDEHYAEAERLESIDPARAQVHATLALVGAIRSREGYKISNDDVMRCPHGAVICGLCGYGVNAGDGGR